MPPKQTTTLTSLFAKSVKATTVATVATGTVATTVAEKPDAAANTVKTDVADADLRAFYASLSPRERIAHAIAVTDLGSSYDVRKTHGFTRWLSARPH